MFLMIEDAAKCEQKDQRKKKDHADEAWNARLRVVVEAIRHVCVIRKKRRSAISLVLS